MSDGITSALERKLALERARSALKSQCRSEMESALRGLPSTGRKAERLRAELAKQLEMSRSMPEPPPRAQSIRASCVSDGVRYEFRTLEFSDLSFFRASRVGPTIVVDINAAHPFGKLIDHTGRIDDPVIMAMLASWAHYECDQISHTRQQVVSDARVDWSRVLRRLVSTESDFLDNAAY
jgi:hypothetical protein